MNQHSSCGVFFRFLKFLRFKFVLSSVQTMVVKVVKLPGNAVRQLLTPVFRRTEEQSRMTSLHRLKAEAHYVVIITLKAEKRLFIL